MKRLLFLFLMGLFLFGCGTTSKQSEVFWQHSSHFKNWDHMKFSLWEYRNPTEENYKKSTDQGWWGEEIPYIPAQ